MHVAKYSKSGLSVLFNHFERKNKNYKNKDIDTSKSHLNYNLAPTHEEGLYKFTKNRVEELNVIKRKNAIWCFDWCVSAPTEIKNDEEKCKLFFQEVYNFLENRYGKENVVSAWVHMDEFQSSGGACHLHYCSTAVLQKQECEFNAETGNLETKTVNKVCAKELLNRLELNTIHSDLQNYLDEHLDFKASVLNGSTKDGNKSIDELKKNKDLTEQIKSKEQQLNKMKKEIETLATNFINLNQKANYYNNSLVEEEKERKKEFKECSEHINNLLNSYDVAFDSVINQLENRDNRIYNIDLSYKKSLEILKELDNANKEMKKVQGEIELKKKEYNKNLDDELDFA